MTVAAHQGGVVVRAATAADLDRLLEIETQSFSRPWSRALMARELEHAWSTVLVAECAGDPHLPAVCGFAVCWFIEDEVHLLDIAVDPERRRRGIARTLLERLLETARARSAAFVSLEVRRSNVAAQALYRSMGFAQVGVRRNYYAEDREDAIVMERVP